MAGTETPLADQRRLVGDRVEFLELLDEVGPAETRDIVNRVDHSRSTVTRVLRALQEVSLIAKGDGGYRVTPAGVMATEQHRQYETEMNAVLQAKDVLSALSDPGALPAELVVDAAIIRPEANVPVRSLEAVSDQIRAANTVQAYLPTLVDTHLLRVWYHTVVSEGADSDLFADPELLTVLKGEYPGLLAEMATADGFAAGTVDGPEYGLVRTEHSDRTVVSVVIYESGHTVRGVVRADSTAAVNWADRQFADLAADADDATVDLRSLHTATADGIGIVAGDTGQAGGPESGVPTAEGGLPLDLHEEGFRRLSETYFEARGDVPPEVSWRTGFTLADVRAGHAAERRGADGRSLTDRLVDGLRSGTGHAVLGPPGSGKSTVCKQVACAWYDRDLGPVLYHGQTDTAFESTALLETVLRRVDGHALVVVEDAVRDRADAVFEVMDVFEDADDVSFLLEAREEEWQTTGEAIDRGAHRRRAVTELRVPPLDEADCRRLVGTFTSLVDGAVDVTGEQLFKRVEAGRSTQAEATVPTGDALVAQHHLSQAHVQSGGFDGETPAAGAPTALDEDVRRTVERLDAQASSLPLDLAVLANTLNAAGVPVAPEYLAALAPAEWPDFEDALSQLTGTVIFDPVGTPAGRSAPYRTRHTAWSERFLTHLCEASPQRARERFGECLSALLALTADPERRSQIERRVPPGTYVHRIEVDPGNWVAEVVERVFELGLTVPALAPLFGETDDDPLTVPEGCADPELRLRQAYWRGRLNRRAGNLDRARREFRALRESAESGPVADRSGPVPVAPGVTGGHHGPDRELAGESPEIRRRHWQAVATVELGAVARHCGDLETAEHQHEESLEMFQALEDRYSEALVRKQLGNVAFKRGDIQAAAGHYEDSLAYFQEVGDTVGEAELLHNLGLVAASRGDLSAAEDQLERSLDSYQGASERYFRANVLLNLAHITRDRDDLDTAERHAKRGLALCQEIGSRRREAIAFRRLGSIERKRGMLDAAADHLEESLSGVRQVGDRQEEAHTLERLGAVARERGELDAAADHLERALDLYREIGDRHGEATTLVERGHLAHERDCDQQARSCYAEAAEWTIETGSVDAFDAVRNLVDVCERLDDLEAAAEWCDRAVSFAEDTGQEDAREEFAARLESLRTKL